MKKIFIPLTVLIYIVYAVAIILNNDFLGDIFSPILTLILSGIIFYGYVYRQEIKSLKIFGIFLFLAIFSWFILF